MELTPHEKELVARSIGFALQDGDLLSLDEEKILESVLRELLQDIADVRTMVLDELKKINAADNHGLNDQMADAIMRRLQLEGILPE